MSEQQVNECVHRNSKLEARTTTSSGTGYIALRPRVELAEGANQTQWHHEELKYLTQGITTRHSRSEAKMNDMTKASS